MKTLFLIAALAGAVYLVMQTPAGKNWLEESQNDPELTMQQEIKKLKQTSSQVAKSLENKVTELVNTLNQPQQTQINQLENRIAELENELIMTRVAENKPSQTFRQDATLEEPTQQNVVVTDLQEVYTQSDSVADSAKTLQHRRQAKLQDIAEKMQLSSLQALVD